MPRAAQHEVGHGPRHVFHNGNLRPAPCISGRSPYPAQSMEELELGVARHRLSVSPVEDRSPVGDDQRPGHVARAQPRLLVDLRQQHGRYHRIYRPRHHHLDRGIVVVDRRFRRLRQERRLCGELDAQRRSLCRACGVQDADHLRPPCHPLLRGRRVCIGPADRHGSARAPRHHLCCSSTASGS